jgi:starch-binding outer membrane protein, SusD/RagB family
MYHSNAIDEMKTKSYIKLFVAAALAISLPSCDDFLELDPISSNTTANAFNTGSDAEAALIGAYDTFQQEYYIWDNVIFSDVISDNHYAGGDDPEIYAVENLNFSPTNSRLFRNWTQLYNGIMKANTVIQNVPRIPVSGSFNETRKNEILGEASFLRAYHYYNLV